MFFSALSILLCDLFLLFRKDLEPTSHAIKLSIYFRIGLCSSGLKERVVVSSCHLARTPRGFLTDYVIM